MQLLKSIGILLSLLVLVGLVLGKIGDTFPGMDSVGWVIIVAGFIVIVGSSIAIEPLVIGLQWKWLNANEDRRLYLILIIVVLAFAVTVYLLWPVIGVNIGPHFGPASR